MGGWAEYVADSRAVEAAKKGMSFLDVSIEFLKTKKTQYLCPNIEVLPEEN